MTKLTNFAWKDGQPYSHRFNDVYFSHHNGAQETEHVFLQQNFLAERFATCKNNTFLIAETGFGSALNFVATMNLWHKSAPQDARLHYLSVEKYPLSPPEIRAALELWPQYNHASSQLLEQYTLMPAGVHRMRFLDGRVTLTLMICDLSEMLAELEMHPIPIDVWFLDGFAPAKNPEMWSNQLFKTMADCAQAQTTFATFTSAGKVRRGLQEAGFRVEKVAGHGKKREILRGEFSETSLMPKFDGLSRTPARAVIIGAGIAGCATAHALASRGWRVQILDKREGIAQTASGNPIGILYPRLALDSDIAGQFSIASHLNAFRLLQRIGPEANIYEACGLMQCIFSTSEIARAKKIAEQHAGLIEWLEADEASSRAGVPLQHGALYLPYAGWVRPKALCEALCTHANIEIRNHSNALQLRQSSGGWQIYGEEALLVEAEIVVIANADAAREFAQLAHLPLSIARGQSTLLRASSTSMALKTVLCGDGYITPAINNEHALGASFILDDLDTTPRHQEDIGNLEYLRSLSPSLHDDLHHQIIGNHVATRCLTPDHLPLAGAMLDSEALTKKPPRHNINPGQLPWMQGLYLNVGHGSKGYTNAPMCAELIASLVCREPMPLATKLMAAVNPNRFVLKALGAKALVAASACHT